MIMLNIDTFIGAYFEAIYFTECGPDSEHGDDPQMSALSRANAMNDCRRFFSAYQGQIGNNIKQAGHDFWLTRNGHGTGFWDRPELYGEENADELTRACKAMGEVYIDWTEG